MSAARHDIVLEEESEFEASFVWEDENCNPKDVTGYGAKLEIRNDREDTSPVLAEASTANGRITVDGTNGKFSVLIPETVVNSMATTLTGLRGEYDFLIWPSASTPSVGATRLLTGRVRYEKAATYA